MISQKESGSFVENTHMYDANNHLVAIFQIEKKVICGKCTLLYKTGELYFSGYLSQGYRNGLGIEYNKNGTIIFKGFFQNGCRNFHITNRIDRSNYWNERDDTGNLVSVCRKDESGENDGICYFYSNGNIKHISRWKHGKEVEILHTFEGEIMKSFNNNKLVYYGEYLKESDFEYIPQENQMTTRHDRSESESESKWKWKKCKIGRDGVLIFIMGLGLIDMVLFVISCLIGSSSSFLFLCGYFILVVVLLIYLVLTQIYDYCTGL